MIAALQHWLTGIFRHLGMLAEQKNTATAASNQLCPVAISAQATPRYLSAQDGIPLLGGVSHWRCSAVYGVRVEFVGEAVEHGLVKDPLALNQSLFFRAVAQGAVGVRLERMQHNFLEYRVAGAGVY